MTDQKIREHEALKKKFSSYPKLPKYVRNRNVKGYVEPNEGLRHSCVMGFYGRLDNWYRQNTPEYKA